MPKPVPAVLDSEPTEWTIITGSAGDNLHVAFVDYEGEHYTLLRDDEGTILVYDKNEWECFIDGVNKGEFD